ncbi:hypothetical protein [Alienimonas californiensis]|uniref:Uncharacterized protein n=1 Tax=Alienimonas californiensis TaxID=2527989 RepID=A0A517P824_9PLAN|nr:hypothetical protein [Alienimonas californiensis]QDT15528.1 hypothetical protein CA12_16130 [Alienimonas californiensis]
MIAAPLLLACLLAPPAVPEEGEPLAGLALERRAAAELEAALDAPLAAAVDIRPDTSVTNALSILLPDQTVLPDTPALDLEGIDLRDLPLPYGLRLPAGRFPVRTAVDEVLRQVNDVPLAFLNDGGILRVTTQDAADETLFTRVYPVRDLLEAAGPSYAWEPPMTAPQGFGAGQGAGLGQFSLPPVANQVGAGAEPPAATGESEPPSPLDVALAAEQPLIDLIQTLTGGLDQGGGWEEIDGEGGSIETFNGVLTIRQTQAVHRQIETLLADLRVAFQQQPWTFPTDLPQAEPPPTAPNASAEEPTE